MIVVPHITPQVELSSLGMADTLILMVLALVVFGPRRLPQIGRQLGKLMYEFRKASNDFKFQMEEELRLAEEADRRKKEEAARAAAAAAPSVAETPQTEPTPVNSPYPGEGVYPPPVGTNSETPAETAAVDEAPKIQPPSTGETVAAQTAEAAETKPENAEAVGQNG
ncbi:MAG TPA: twin-arginine translocase TatA/TatE family subunit [Terracidiphilus sp.]|nr:twin-arginine translocase TatA/TatE family subunit [Terracidiphilus sp.]